jgi:hypothetical protein
MWMKEHHPLKQMTVRKVKGSLSGTVERGVKTPPEELEK